jgi:CRP-like cAMP-binding protein
MAYNLKIQFFKEREQIIKEGDIGDAFYIILSGNVEIRKKRTETHAVNLDDIYIGELSSGMSFGELAL